MYLLMITHLLLQWSHDY